MLQWISVKNWFLIAISLFVCMGCVKKQFISKYEKSRFLEKPFGVIFDIETGLEWYIGPDVDMDWYAAKKWTDGLRVDGKAWRMPEIWELRSLFLFVDEQGEKRLPISMGHYQWVWSDTFVGNNTQFPSCAMFFGDGGSTQNNSYTSSGRRAFAVRSVERQMDLQDQFSLVEKHLNNTATDIKGLEEAYRAIRAAAEQGNATAQYYMGHLHKGIIPAEMDSVEAVKWFEKAAAQGHADACYYLGLSYESGIGVEADDLMSLKYYQKAAGLGSARAQSKMGSVFFWDDYEQYGIKQDYASAAEWYQKAADQGYADAQFWLAVIYSNGKGVEQDCREAVRWFKKASEQGVDAAGYQLGSIFEIGCGKVAQDHEMALQWYRKAADQGNFKARQAIKNLNIDYSNPESVLEAAEQQNTEAQYRLAMMYATGKGVEKNGEEAVKWFFRSAIGGNKKSQAFLAAYYEFAASQGDPDAQYILGILHMKGLGVRQDPMEAFKWFKKAADQGHTRAKKEMDLMSQ